MQTVNVHIFLRIDLQGLEEIELNIARCVITSKVQFSTRPFLQMDRSHLVFFVKDQMHLYALLPILLKLLYSRLWK